MKYMASFARLASTFNRERIDHLFDLDKHHEGKQTTTLNSTMVILVILLR